MSSEGLHQIVTTLLLALKLVLFFSSPARGGELETPDQILQYLTQHRKDAAVVSYTVRPDGAPDPADPILLHNADQPMPLASTIKIVVLAAYAREVTAGRLDPEAKVTLGAWEDYYLPGTDGGAHPAALAALEIPTDERGFATNPEKEVTLDNLAHVMIRFSDNAATDFLMARIGRENLRATIAAAGLSGQELPLPILGVFLSWYNHEDGNLTSRRLRKLLAMSNASYAAEVDRLTAAFQKEDWRAAELQFLLNGRAFSGWHLESRAAGALFPQGTAGDYGRILAGVTTGTFLSPEVSAVMRRHLDIPLPNQDVFLTLGFKGGALAGVLTGAYYFTPTVGDFAGKPHVSVVFLRDLPARDWTRLLETAGQEAFALRLGLDRALAEQAQRTLARRR